MARTFADEEEPSQGGVVRQILGGVTTVDWSQFEALAAFRCTVGVAVPLLVGLSIGRPSVGVFGAVGAVSVGFGSFQGAYRSRAAVMLWAAVAMAVSLFVGGAAGHTILAATVITALWGFGSGLLVALGPSASFVGLQAAVALVVAGGFPVEPGQAFQNGLLVLAGGLLQTLLVVIVWPLRRFSTERRLLGDVYKSLADYAATVPADPATFPDPRTLAEAQSALLDPQPFARSREVAVFQALLDEAERIRASLVALANHYARTMTRDEASGTRVPLVAIFIANAGRVLAAMADAVREGRAPAAPDDLWPALEDAARQLRSETTLADALLGQLRAAWRTVGVPAADGEERDGDAATGELTASAGSDSQADRRLESRASADPRVGLLPRLPPIKEGLQTLWANVTLQSTACRHALRLAMSLAITTAASRAIAVQRGYWVSLTTLLVLKPEFHETFTRSLARVVGTLVGAGCATIVAHWLAPGPSMLTFLVLVCVFLGYSLFRASYAVFTICITGYVVFLITLSGAPERDAALERSLHTVIGGGLAMLVYAVWPTWEGSHVRELLSALLQAQARYVTMLLKAHADPARCDIDALNEARLAVRLARSNAEASVERMLIEPVDRAPLAPRVARGLLAASRRIALATLSLHASREHAPTRQAPDLDRLAEQVGVTLDALAADVRGDEPLPEPSALPALRETHLALAKTAPTLVVRETDLLVDSVNTMTSLLSASRAAADAGPTAGPGGSRGPRGSSADADSNPAAPAASLPSAPRHG